MPSGTERASENRFPLVRIVIDDDSPGLPPAGELHIRVDSDGFYSIDPDGLIVRLGSAGSHSHAGSDITSGTVADARIASTIARDSELPDLAGHLADSSDAHDAAAISIADAGNHFTATDVEGALQELGAGGGGGSAPDMAPDLIAIYPQGATNGTSHVATIAAAASGNRLIVAVASYNRDVNTPTCTNVTFTEVLAVNFGNAYLSIFVGVVSGGSSGTSVTVTATGSNWIIVDVYEVADALTPTAGASVTVANTNAQAVTTRNVGRVAAAQGAFVIFGVAQDDGTTGFGDWAVTAASIRAYHGANAGLASGIGRSLGPSVSGYFTGGSNNADVAAGIVVVS